ncbi:VanZ family protein [Frigoribacterium sp. PvP120]|jgi:VanZ family protein|uniref:VanZ family protein n=1 Tax=unclassified Frigoribacterium TaxID=2627005 RepID=UPI001AEA57AD|nr:VanZ family protein [Frigoribacterium sp. PvP121]MBP1242230.1 VanZ family protein [Frigoribacterium sp. PvP121]
MRRAVLLLATLAYLAGVAWMTLRPTVYGDGTSELLWRVLDLAARHEETDWITFARVEAAANVAMFVPMGMFPALLLPKRAWWVGVVVGLVATVAIESYQATVLSATRFADPQDLVMNTLGAAIGAAFVGLVLPRSRRSRRRGRSPRQSPAW